MSTFSPIKIIGVDESRPPRIRKESYIDLFFRLSEQAPADWCEDFNALARQLQPIPKIDPASGVCIDTYVNDMDNIAAHLAEIKTTVNACNEQFLEKIRQREAALAASNADLMEEGGAQYRLNQIVAALEFDA